jgi:ARG and Rhodanese-Phosphatase-superfamily-associated Protein domain
MHLTTHAFQVGEPVEHRGIIVTPLFPTVDPVAAYISLDEALPAGLRITETSDAGSVPELAVVNPLAQNVLLYDGEELVGAKQNRILNLTVLVGAASTLPVPVSCVEQGRWSRATHSFGAAAHISHSHLRRRKAQSLAATPLARGVAQSEVWAEIGEKQRRLGVDSPTAANRDTFDAYAGRLREIEDAFPHQPGQCGAVLAIGDDLCLDAVSRPDVFGRLWPKLRAGYLLDAVEALGGRATPSERIAGFLDEVGSATVTHGPSAGLGRDVRLRGTSVIGSGLDLDGERIQLSAFTCEGNDGRRAFGRITRPSERR